MKTWTPLWSSIVDSSVWGEDKDVKILWITMLAKKDRDGFVEMSLPGLARASVLSLEECQKALAVLSSPDSHSRTKLNEGRRVEPVEGGWMVLNHGIYRAEIAKLKQREQQCEWQRNYRARKNGVNGSSAGEYLPSELESKSSDRDPRPTIEELKLQGAKIGLPDRECEKFMAFYESKGWKVGKSPMKNWRSALAGWRLRWQEGASARGATPDARSLSDKILDEALNATIPEIPL